MSLPHALLTSLLEKPSSGSELARRFGKSIGFFWQATHQQIYRELARLEAQGWVKSEADEGARGRKRRYEVLQAGRDELLRWTQEASEARHLRDELMVRLRAAAVLGTAACEGLEQDIHTRLLTHRAQLQLYRDIERRDFKGKTPNQALQLQHLLLQAGIDYEHMYIDFCERALRVMKDNGIAVNDLYTFVKPRMKELQIQPANVHFVPAGSEALAAEVVKAVQAALQ